MPPFRGSAGAPPGAHILLLTGVPGVGKTTVLQEAARRLAGLRVAGFYTEEIRGGGQRLGFRLVGFEGGESIIAHVAFGSAQHVGKYAVDVAAIDRGVEQTLGPHIQANVYLVDEVGKMECLSERFVAAMRRLLDLPAQWLRRSPGPAAASSRRPGSDGTRLSGR
jgi:nucleoside-triphosphatase